MPECPDCGFPLAREHELDAADLFACQACGEEHTLATD
jgi:hypothetical protein